MRDTAAAIRQLVLDLIHDDDDARDDARFSAIACRVFAFQFEHNAPYRGFCIRRGVTPADVSHWTHVPAVPTAAFKEVALIAGTAEHAQALFRTSGTTRGAERRGQHYVLDLSLYHAALLRSFRACVLPDDVVPFMISLIPSAAAVPDSSLSHMAAVVMQQLGTADSSTVADPVGGIDYDGLDALLRSAELELRPVCLLGTSFAFVHWLDLLGERDTSYSLPAGSRIMDTGGFKGRSREVGAAQLHDMYHRALGVAHDHIVNEYGMTELCSQFYDSRLRDRVHAVARPSRMITPHWVRTRVVDPETLQPLPAGATGILQHHDLANAFSVAAVQTEDLGAAQTDGFAIFGRAPGAAPRGCSIAMDMLLESLRHGHA